MTPLQLAQEAARLLDTLHTRLHWATRASDRVRLARIFEAADRRFDRRFAALGGKRGA